MGEDEDEGVEDEAQADDFQPNVHGGVVHAYVVTRGQYYVIWLGRHCSDFTVSSYGTTTYNSRTRKTVITVLYTDTPSVPYICITH